MLELEAVSFSYGRKTVLSGVSFSARAGTLVALLGANGAGKSTLLKVASGYLKPASGRVLFGGADISDMPARTLAGRRAVLEQECGLSFGYSVLETVKLGAYARVGAQRASVNSDALRALNSVGLADFESRLYCELSGGEKRRVQMARALCQLGSDPRGKILLLDEPSAGLDPAHAHLVMGAARRAADAGAAVCAVLHDVNLASAYSDKIALLKNGKILKAAPVGEMLDADLLSEAYGARCGLIKAEGFKYPFAYFSGGR